MNDSKKAKTSGGEIGYYGGKDLEGPMEALILNGSPRGSRGVTGKLLQSLADGLAAGGASITGFRVAEMHIEPCNACLSCMHKHPGVCVQKDDMERIYERLKVSELLVLGTPVYTDSMTAQIKAVIDRSVCSLQPFLMKDPAGRIRHPCWWSMPAKFLLVATSGFPEAETFDPLIATVKAQATNMACRLIGCVCVPGSIALQVEPSKMAHHRELLSRLGSVIAQTGEADRELLAALNIPPLTVTDYLTTAASYETWCRRKLGMEKAHLKNPFPS
jgi:multimeric flavodoxin WrbA